MNPLYLLPPSQLPTSATPIATESARLQSVLDRLLIALNQTDPSQSLMDINAAIARLGDPEVEAAQISNTHTKLQYWEVEDYDQYFQVFHVQSPQPDRALVYGLLITCHRFCQTLQSHDFDADRVAESRAGFISYAQLLQRLFGFH
jgi:hypothetical protein